jgi:cytochrome b6-f complex iron-sulfur subunit
MADKPSTEDILKKIRQQNAAGSGAAKASSDDTTAEESTETPAVEEAVAPAKPAARSAPKGTADILASIRTAGGSAAAKADTGDDAPAEKPKPTAAPKGTAGILASIRSQGGSTSSTEAPRAPAQKKPAATPAGDLPPVSEMLQQMKAGKPGGAVAKAAPATPQLRVPTKPEKTAAQPQTRRNVLLTLVATPFALAWTLLAGISGVWGLAIARYMFPNVLVELPSRFNIGAPSDFPPESVSTKFTAARGIWIVRTSQYNGKDLIYALASVCTHLGCTPSWLEGEQKFKCPCHGSGFYKNGINFEGPAPRPLERVGLQIAADGTLEVDKSVKFQEEKGQWEDSKSFVDAALV